MKTPKIVDAMGYLDEDLILEASCPKRNKSRFLLTWGALAACFVLMLSAAIVFSPALFDKASLAPEVQTGEPGKESASLPSQSHPPFTTQSKMPSVGEVLPPASTGEKPPFSTAKPLPPASNSEVVPPAPFSTVYSTGGEAAYVVHYVYHVVGGDYASYVGGKVIEGSKLSQKLQEVSVLGGWKVGGYEQWLSQETLRAEVYEIEGIDKEIAVALRFLDQGEALTTTHYYVILNPLADWSSMEEYVIRFEDSISSGEEILSPA